MATFKFIILIAATALMFPFTALSWDNGGVMSEDQALVTSGDHEEYTGVLKDERILDIEEAYSRELSALVEVIESESDVSERERLQKEASLLKEEEEMLMKELFIEIAVEQGDDVRAAELQDALNTLSQPGQAKPVYEGQGHSPDFSAASADNLTKNPDDQ